MGGISTAWPICVVSRTFRIVDTLRGMDADHLGRQAVDRIFRVRECRARQIMASLAGLQFGNADAVSIRAPSVRVEESAANRSDPRGVS